MLPSESEQDPPFGLFPSIPLVPTNAPARPCNPSCDAPAMSHTILIPSTSTQSVAALLPPEIVDCIFSHFDFDYSIYTLGKDLMERTSNLSNMSVIAEGWREPARRLLCRTVRIVRWEQLAEGVSEWARGGLQNMAIVGHLWDRAQTQEAASATFRILKTAPNLRLLHLSNLPFHSFSSTESISLRTTHSLPFSAT